MSIPLSSSVSQLPTATETAQNV
uniref:Uncharacterized protein n=1 Tax=Arundo donax TaxID=35708 RepID=A0A0A9B8G6_ARUDO